jgi:hypothetical protein
MKIIDLDIFGKSPMNPPNSFSFPSLIVAIAPFHMVGGYIRVPVCRPLLAKDGALHPHPAIGRSIFD